MLTGERPFSCKVCNRSFSEKKTLVNHERIHTGEKPYSCQFCDMVFPFQQSFRKHVRLHMGDKRWKCEECGKLFMTKFHLLEHKRTHTGEKPFNCEFCDKSFATRQGLKRHERVHSDVKPLCTEPSKKVSDQYVNENQECPQGKGEKSIEIVTATSSKPNQELHTEIDIDEDIRDDFLDVHDKMLPSENVTKDLFILVSEKSSQFEESFKDEIKEENGADISNDPLFIS